jgi:hypothetical protein
MEIIRQKRDIRPFFFFVRVTPSCNLYSNLYPQDRLSGLVVRVLGYRFWGPGSIPGTTRKKK